MNTNSAALRERLWRKTRELIGFSEDMQYSDGTSMKIWHDQYREHAALRDVGLLPQQEESVVCMPS